MCLIMKHNSATMVPNSLQGNLVSGFPMIRLGNRLSESQAFPIAANSKSSTEKPCGRYSFSLRNLEHPSVSFNA